MLALLRHVIAHDGVAGLGHPRHVGAPPFGDEADAEHAGLQIRADPFCLGKMRVHLVACLVQGFELGARELELAARLQCDGRAVGAGERDGLAVLLDGRPTEAFEGVERRRDPVGAVIGERAEIGPPEREFLVLGADAPIGFRLAALLVIADELIARRDRRNALFAGRGHEAPGPA